MNTSAHFFRTLIAPVFVSLLLLACSSAPPEGAVSARSRLTQLQSDPQLASLAPVAIKDAEDAVRAAEKPQKDKEVSRHLVFMADRKIDIARAQAEARLMEDQRKTLSEQRERARLEARTREADRARGEAVSARTEADVARSQAEAAGVATEAAKQQAEDLQKQIAELNARTSDRGLVVTLGDVLFAAGKAGLRGHATSNLSKLAAFLNRYQDRTVIIEGHTDSVGSEASNLALSQRRADSVKSYLVSQGIASARLTASGKGESSPVADNHTASGRQQNRRVEVIISNPDSP